MLLASSASANKSIVYLFLVLLAEVLEVNNAINPPNTSVSYSV